MAISSIQEFLVPIFYSRKLLLFPSLHRSLMSSPVISPPPPPTSRDLLQPSSGDSSFDANIVMVILVLVCALICSVGLNSIINCAFRCTRLITSDNNVRNQISSSGKVPNAGIDKKALKKFPVVSYSEDLKTPGLETECVICLAEFSPGNKIRVLPKCNHVFHVRCIDKWLSCHTSCPTCRHCLIETCQKVSGGGASIGTQSNNAALPPVPPPEVIVRIAPLEPEGMVHNIHGLDEISGS